MLGRVLAIDDSSCRATPSTGRIPFTRSCMPRPIEKVVLPDDEGPAIRMIRGLGRRSRHIGDSGDLFSWKPSVML